MRRLTWQVTEGETLHAAIHMPQDSVLKRYADTRTTFLVQTSPSPLQNYEIVGDHIL